MDEKILELENLIIDYKNACREKEDMKFNWENDNDPSSDPGLQFTKDCEIERLYNQIKEFSNKL
jgi:hypothetical protein